MLKQHLRLMSFASSLVEETKAVSVSLTQSVTQGSGQLSFPLFLVLVAAYLVPGLIGHDPWKQEETYIFGIVHHMLQSGDLVVLAEFAIASCGFALSRTRAIAGGVVLSLGIGTGFLGKGLIAPGTLGVTAVLLPVLFREWRGRTYFQTLCVACWSRTRPSAPRQRSIARNGSSSGKAHAPTTITNASGCSSRADIVIDAAVNATINARTILSGHCRDCPGVVSAPWPSRHLSVHPASASPVRRPCRPHRRAMRSTCRDRSA